LPLPRDSRQFVAFLDIGLPGMDGYELCALLRATPQLADCWFVALTDHGGAAANACSAAAGFDAHLTKPVVVENLLDTVVVRPRSLRAAP
jgi:two-component system, sensor histidine kinase